MSAKSIIGGALVLVGAILTMTGVGAAIGLPMIGLGISSATVIGLGLMVAGSMLMGPTMPKMPGSLANGGRDRLFASLDLKASRKILFGDTAGATDVRYQTYTGDEQEYMEQIVCVASHKVNSIYELWLDNEKVWTSAGGAQGDFVGYITVTVRLEATTSDGIAIDAVWTADATLTGCAYLHIEYKLTGPDDQTPGPFSSGVSQRMTVRCKGALVYDPRLDSTVAGGSGAHRAATQSTWAWSDNASRNPALQMLWFLLGWKINSKLAVGMGLPPARIDLPSFITAANVCDESVTKNGGGTEPRYRSDGVLSESDDRNAVVEQLCASMNAIVRDNGGKLSLTVLKNDLAVPVASFDDNDVLAGMEWDQTPDLSATFNITRGQRIDPSDSALYQPVDYAEVVLTSTDGIDRIDSFDLPLVQSNGQAQRLAKQRLQRNQYQGRLRLNGKPKWWQVNIGDVVAFSHQTYGWTSKLFRVVGQKISRGGETEMVLIEEHANIYQWDNDETAAVVGGTPTIYDPNNSPIFKGIGSAGAITTGNMLTDTQFSTKWTKSAGASRKVARIHGALLGYARGAEPYFLELSPSTTLVRSALSEKVPVNPGQKYYFRMRAQRGTTLGSGSRLNMGGQWLASDGVTVVGSFTEGTQQTPSTLTAGALPKEVSWAGTAPATAFFVQIKPYTPALASSSGTFRVEGPWVSIVDAGGTPEIGHGPSIKEVLYSAANVVEGGQLPFDLAYKMYLGGIEQTAGVTWTYKLTSGGINTFTSASGVKSMTGTGLGTLTLSSLEYDASTVEITATHSNGSVAKAAVTITKKYAATSGVVGGGGAAGDIPSQTSGFTSFNTTSFAVISNELLYTVPTGKTSIDVTINLSLTPSGTTAGNWDQEVKVQRDIGGVWTDQGAVFAATSSITVDGDTGEKTYYSGTPSGTRSSTSLTAGVQYKYRLVARLLSGTRAHNVTGSFSLASP